MHTTLLIGHRACVTSALRLCPLSPFAILLLISLFPTESHEGLFSVVTASPAWGIEQFDLEAYGNKVWTESSIACPGIPNEPFFTQNSSADCGEDSHWSHWSWSVGQHLACDLRDESTGELWANRERLSEFLFQQSPSFHFGKLPLDVSFQPLGTDPLLHAPAWWDPRGRVDSKSAINFWACEQLGEQGTDRDSAIRAGMRLTLDLLSGPEWDCRITGNVDQRGEAGILLQFCWH